MSLENKNILRRLYDEFVDRGNAQVLEEIVSPDFVSDAATAVKGAEAVKAIVLPVREAFPDLHHTIHELIAEGDRVAVRWTMKGTHRGTFSGIPATGKPVAFGAISIYRFHDGKIVELWAQVDRLGLLQQLGAVPRTTVPSTIRLLTPGVWHVDPDHSEVTFRVKAMWGLTTVSGRFKVLDGTIHVREAMAHGRLRAHATSIDTGIRMRDGHLRSADFFDAEHHPYLEFSVQNLADAGDGRVRVAGDLVIRGMAYPLEVEAMVRDAGNGTIETAAQAMVDREAIGRSLKRGGMIKGPGHLAARIRLVRDGDTRPRAADGRG